MLLLSHVKRAYCDVQTDVELFQRGYPSTVFGNIGVRIQINRDHCGLPKSRLHLHGKSKI